MTDLDTRDLLNVAIDAAYAAGRRTLAYFNTRLDVELKRDQTPVTVADREAERIIRESIARVFPTHSILGEEHGVSEGDPDYRWIIDPIDGTKSFICGVPLFGVLIGLEVRGRADVGVCYLPALDEMVAAGRGLGCTWNGRPARVADTTDLGQAVLTTSSPMSCISRSDAFERLSARCRVTRAWGDCYGYVLVATGRAHIMLDPRMNPWDCGPFLPILTEAGGHFTDWKGRETIWSPEAVATSAGIHEQVLQVLQSERLRSDWIPSKPHALALSR